MSLLPFCSAHTSWHISNLPHSLVCMETGSGHGASCSISAVNRIAAQLVLRWGTTRNGWFFLFGACLMYAASRPSPFGGRSWPFPSPFPPPYFWCSAGVPGPFLPRLAPERRPLWRGWRASPALSALARPLPRFPPALPRHSLSPFSHLGGRSPNGPLPALCLSS